ncbi:GNAT family N-acetyltransferase [Dyadobacter fanqingshengii]|uniref:N-acetyltransferase family protein n=1 Tax=Dyadobacter fanqingshengii TaxID=2906443 RepID=A0A9X1PA85_9BACT|nr:GNAT family N-acetyltransferase [Dyadobacter fanqingshengii]MCF0041514.1 N-acetyltransferase family protein [Dyadobacter fanqingshengii]USJ36767.1 GNAT family N-acetyltransferase [Dyadobacter fanqingshengii]
MAFNIRTLTVSDWPAIKEIYQQGINTGNATYETQAPEVEELKGKFLSEPQLVADDNGQVIGWAMLSAVSSRCVYGGVAETSIYVHSGYQGEGVGRTLLSTLVPLSEQLGFWTLQAQIFPENKASIALHEQQGFRRIGYREKLGKRNGIWRDVLFLERRSLVAGNE